MANPEVDKCFNALMDAADALEQVAGKVAEAACQLHKLFDWDDQIPTEAATEASVPALSLVPAPEPEPEPSPVATVTVSFEQVRAVLADKSRDGHTAAIRGLLAQFGAPKLSEIDPAHYPALLAEVEALGVAS